MTTRELTETFQWVGLLVGVSLLISMVSILFMFIVAHTAKRQADKYVPR